MPEAVFIIDEFDRAAVRSAKQFTDLIKALSDFALDCTVILVGVSDTVDELVADHASIGRAMIQILLPRMEPKELREILTNAEKQLNVHFAEDAAKFVVHVSQGLPHYTHLIGLHTVRQASNRRSSEIQRGDVFYALKDAAKQAQQSVTEKYAKAIHSAHKDALYRQVLLACALTAAYNNEPLGYFNPAQVVARLTTVLGRDVQIGTFNNHLSEFCQVKRGQVLERAGQVRAYRYRFRDPLLVPFVLMDAVANGLISDADLSKLVDVVA